MQEGEAETLRSTAEEISRMLFAESETIAEEIARAIRAAGIETRFTRAEPRQQVEWLVLDVMAATRSLANAEERESIERIVFHDSHFGPESDSVLSPAVVIGCNLEAMRVIARHVSSHCQNASPEKREQALRTVVALFGTPIAIGDRQLSRRIADFEERIIAGELDGPSAFALSGVRIDDSGAFGLGAFSEREREVFELVSLGKDNASIARALSVSENTVKSHVRNMLAKTKLSNRTQLAILGLVSGSVDADTVCESLVAAQSERM